MLREVLGEENIRVRLLPVSYVPGPMHQTHEFGCRILPWYRRLDTAEDRQRSRWRNV